MKAYLDILKKITESPYSVHKPTRTGVDTISLTGVQFKHDMKDGFPLLTTKKMGIKSISAELEFFIKGLSDKKWLQDRGCHIWDEWANPEKVKRKYDEEIIRLNLNPIIQKTLATNTLIDRLKIQKEENDLGRIYGVQWRDWRYIYENGSEGKIDQLQDVIKRAKRNPLDRRLLVSAWRPDELDKMALPPCHYVWQILSDGNVLDLIWTQRSCDIFLGIPYNIASYGLLLLLVAKELNLIPRLLIGQLGDTHIYENHKSQVREQLHRIPYKLPTLKIPDDTWTNIFEWEYTDIELKEYKSHPKIKAEIAI